MGQLPLTPSFTLEQTMKIKTVKKKSGSTITVGFTVTWPNELAPLPPNHKEHWLREAAGNPKVIEKLKEWKIHQSFYNDLCSLNRFDFALVLDDSGSMRSSAGNGRTRW